MKKMILTAAVALAAFGANAQEDNSPLNFTGEFPAIIQITPSAPWNATAEINTLAQIVSGVAVIENPNVAPGPAAYEFEFTTGASRGYAVAIEHATTLTGPEAGMSCTTLVLSGLSSLPVGSTAAFVGSQSLSVSGVTPLFSHPLGHNTDQWGFNMNWNPGFGWDDGNYTILLDVVATLD